MGASKFGGGCGKGYVKSCGKWGGGGCRHSGNTAASNTRHTVSITSDPHSHTCVIRLPPVGSSGLLDCWPSPLSPHLLHTPAWACLPHSPSPSSRSRFRQSQVGITIFIIGKNTRQLCFVRWVQRVGGPLGSRGQSRRGRWRGEIDEPRGERGANKSVGAVLQGYKGGRRISHPHIISLFCLSSREPAQPAEFGHRATSCGSLSLSTLIPPHTCAGFAAQSLLAALGSVQLVCHCVFALFVLKEKVWGSRKRCWQVLVFSALPSSPQITLDILIALRVPLPSPQINPMIFIATACCIIGIFGDHSPHLRGV